ncbi:hypothetical protein CTI12_AA471410 [Artemisia annua]|uniref:Uncharacterized protein n=1 Tax=Artemisia annua TaxID=35608 RepID=A0A2U1LNM2_ARTAN|nr:hypothetical protein CTI12_AA471410 [Artemisia annua]
MACSQPIGHTPLYSLTGVCIMAAAYVLFEKLMPLRFMFVVNRTGGIVDVEARVPLSLRK